MPNKALENRVYKIPDKIVNRIEQMLNKIKTSSDQAKGLQRAKNMVRTRKLTYLQMNKLKHFFENYQGDGSDDEYKLLGGDLTKKWIPKSDLEQEKDSEAKIKDAQMNAGYKNTHIRTHEKDKDNADPTAGKGGMIDVAKSLDSRGIMSGDAIYKSSENKQTTKNLVEGYNKEINSMLYLIKYMNKK
jgi:hypothetical protein